MQEIQRKELRVITVMTTQTYQVSAMRFYWVIQYEVGWLWKFRKRCLKPYKGGKKYNKIKIEEKKKGKNDLLAVRDH